MKYLSGIFVFLFSSTMLFAQDRQVYDQVNDDAALDEYTSYAIGNAFTGDENQAWMKYSSLMNSMVENSIVYEFDTYGYDLDNENGQLVVNFMIFDDVYSDKVGYMPGYRIGDDEFGFSENILDKIGDGTLVISLTDVNEGATVWTGFVTDAINKSANLRDQQKGIRQSVNAAMELFISKTNFINTPLTRFEIITETGDDIQPEDESNE